MPFLSIPLAVEIPRKTKPAKRVALNLNIYRNTHHMTLNQAKAAIKEHVRLAIGRVENIGPGPWEFIYTIFPQTGRAFDLGNVGSIVQKFTDDALVELGVIKDDNHKIISRVVYEFGQIDKENPRAELTIRTA
jgi:hypothetical protein